MAEAAAVETAPVVEATTPVVEAAPSVEVVTTWRDSLPDTLKANPSLADVKDVNALAQQYIDTKAMVGSSVRPPTMEAGADDIKAFNEKLLANEHLGLMVKPDPTDPDSVKAMYQALGAPEDASGYTAPEGSDAEAFGALANKAAELGLTVNQFESLAASQVAMQAEVNNTAVAARDAGLDQLKGQWGAAFDEKVGRAVHMLEQTKAPASLKEAIANNSATADVLAWVDSMATQLGSEGAPMANQLNSINNDTVTEIKQKIEDIGSRILSEDLGGAQKNELIQRRIKLFEQLDKVG